MEVNGIWEEFNTECGRFCAGYPEKVREENPLVHLITNYVTVTDCVNALLASGAKAICSHALKEAAQVTKRANALVCNLGGTEYYDAMDLSAEAALEAKIPLVIDPVGCAASSHRLEKCLMLTDKYHPAAIKGNYAEIFAILDGCSKGSGLDDAKSMTPAEESCFKNRMMAFARDNNVILIASGRTDLCTDGKDLKEVGFGTPALRRITGAGCMGTSVLAAFLSVSRTLECAVSSLSFFALAGEAALKACRLAGTGAGHFHMYLMDALSAADPVWKTDSITEDPFV